MKVTEFRLKMYPKDFNKVRSFYADELQFNIIHEWNRGEQDRGTMFDVGGTTLELLTQDKPHQPVAGADLSLEIEDVWACYEIIKDKNYLAEGLVDNAWGDTSLRIVDPEGLSISLFTKNENRKSQ